MTFVAAIATHEDFLGLTDRMAVERMGRDGPIDRYLFDDFTFDLPEGFDAFAYALEQRFPGITPLVEVTDVATPLTLERYTGNWKGSFEGWLITPDNAGVLMKPMRQTLPALKNFYVCGQWVEPGGGLLTSIMSGRRLMKAICREDGIPFRTDVRPG